MSDSKPATRVFMFFDPKGEDPEKCQAAVSVSAAKIVRNPNWADLRDGKDQTVVTLTWPSRYRVKEM